jgi:hypothetical protein
MGANWVSYAKIKRETDGVWEESAVGKVWNSKSKVKQSLYTPWRRFGGEEI